MGIQTMMPKNKRSNGGEKRCKIILKLAMPTSCSDDHNKRHEDAAAFPDVVRSPMLSPLFLQNIGTTDASQLGYASTSLRFYRLAQAPHERSLLFP